MTAQSYSLTATWQKIASVGASVTVQNTGDDDVILVAASSVPTGSNGLVLRRGMDRPFTVLSADLYARANRSSDGVIQIVDTFGAASAAPGAAFIGSGKAPAVDTFSASGQSSQPFGPVAGRDFYIHLGALVDGVVELRKYSAVLSQYVPLFAGGSQLYRYTNVAAPGLIDIAHDEESGALFKLYCLALNGTSVTLNYGFTA